MSKTREKLIKEVQNGGDNFISKNPDAPIDIKFYFIWEFEFSEFEMKTSKVLKDYLYLWKVRHNMPKPIRDKLISEIKSGIDCEKKVQALIKLYEE